MRVELKREREGLIIDVGVSEGNDTAFYLSKGFQVIAVEADPAMYQQLRQRFAKEIEDGEVLLLNVAAANSLGETVEFYAHATAQGISSTKKREEVDQEGYTTHHVMTINWRALCAQAGVPRYLKVDIEGEEEGFLAGLYGERSLPEFVSVEAYKHRPCQMLHELGYRRFRLIDQMPSGGLRLPARQLEGLTVTSANFSHASGPFGLDVFCDGGWLSFEEFTHVWEEAEPFMNRTWFDCHAWRPN
jgi:FkbM family methyltransferase